jgi:ADP-ribose pyrophosphatase YjhB (NUDIX family)
VARDPIPTWYFAVVVVKHGDRFLLVQERKHGQLWYLPAGRAEFGETLPDAAVRETLEESGVHVRLLGVLGLEHSPYPKHARVRAVFLAEPSGSTEPKKEADAESLQARWVSVDELSDFSLRGPEVEQLIRYVASGGPCAPVDIIRGEGLPYLLPGARPNEEV